MVTPNPIKPLAITFQENPMPFLTPEQRDLVKSVLDGVLTDQDLTDQFNKAKARRAGPVSDHKDAMLGQYMGILKEISDERASRKPPQVDAQSPDLETLKKKYFKGPKG
jgi:hypothetical protein